jgi:hypothetical protein
MKVYLAKSNSCDPEVYMKVKKYIKDNIKCELLEYSGGTYDPSVILMSDYLVVIPPDLDYDTRRAFLPSIHTGKGQFEQCKNFAMINYHSSTNGTSQWFQPISLHTNKVLVLTRFLSDRPLFSPLRGLEQLNTNDWKASWGKIHVGSGDKTLSDWLVHEPKNEVPTVKMIVPHLACRNLFK